MKILIIKEKDNDFEKCVSCALERYADVVPVYRKRNGFTDFVRKVHKHVLPLKSFYRYWFGDWKNRLDEYDRVIIFDTSMSQLLIDFFDKSSNKGKIVLWFWNSFEQLPVSVRSLRAYSFDPDDCRRFGLGYASQFYFQPPIKIDNVETKWDVFFVGEDKGRKEQLLNLCKEMKKIGLAYKIIIKSKIAEAEQNGGVDYTTSMIPYKKVIRYVEESKCLLELCKDGQSGLSLRAMEALFYNKKLITNNKNLTEYEFYSPQNIFILGIDNLDELPRFISGETKLIDKSVKNKYTIQEWIHNICHNDNEYNS